MDAYKVLGVKKNASKNTIRKAYRKLAMENHPDRNPGDKAKEERFREVQAAYDSLNGKQARVEESMQHGAICSELCGMFMQILAVLADKGVDPIKEDIVAMMDNSLVQSMTKLRDDKRKIEAAQASVKKMLGRFTVTDEENIFESALKKKLDEDWPRQLSNIESGLARLEQCRKFLKFVAARLIEAW